MYVGSSYNDTISGDTLSSLSEKSDSYFTSDLENCQRKNFVVSILTKIFKFCIIIYDYQGKEITQKIIIIGRD